MLLQTGNIGDITVYRCMRTAQKCAAYEKTVICHNGQAEEIMRFR